VHTLELPHPTIPGLVLVLLVHPQRARVAWRWRGRVWWVGLPCEA